MPDLPRYDDFLRAVDTPFRVNLGVHGAVELRLAEVTDHGSAEERARGRESFSLLFLGPLERALPQGTLAFEHDALGAFPMFIVPVGIRREGREYEAVFNRLPE